MPWWTWLVSAQYPWPQQRQLKWLGSRTGVLIHGLPMWLGFPHSLDVVAGLPAWISRAPGAKCQKIRWKTHHCLWPSLVRSHGITHFYFMLWLKQPQTYPDPSDLLMENGKVTLDKSRWANKDHYDDHWIIQCNTFWPLATTIHIIPTSKIQYTLPKTSKVSIHYGIRTVSDLVL